MAARSGMADIITQVRQLAAAGTADYTIAGSTHWSDDHLQTVLDRVRVEVWREPVQPIPILNTGGTTEYKEYRLPWTWLEATTGGSAIFTLTNASGALIGTANYTVDYQYGRVTFGATQAGSARYVTARSYDVYEAAARVWEQKAGHVALKYDFSADGASFKASQERANYMAQAQAMRALSNSGGLTTGRMQRDDVTTVDWPGSLPKSFHVTY